MQLHNTDVLSSLGSVGDKCDGIDAGIIMKALEADPFG